MVAKDQESLFLLCESDATALRASTKVHQVVICAALSIIFQYFSRSLLTNGRCFRNSDPVCKCHVPYDLLQNGTKHTGLEIMAR
jgi:hypothetical protein